MVGVNIEELPSRTAVLQAIKAWNPEKFLRRRLPYVTTTKKARDAFFSWRFMNQVNDFSNSLYYKQLLQWLVEGVM